MNKIFTGILILTLIFAGNVFGQSASGIPFSFTVTTPATAPPALTNITVPAVNSDEWDTLIAPAGWSFVFAGVTYTKVVISSNGWLALIPAAVAVNPLPYPANSLPNNLLSNNTTGYPIIAPLWDDHSSAIVAYNVTAGVLSVRWYVKWQKANATVATSLFWVDLNGNAGINTIGFHYFNNAAYVPVTPSASIGIAGVCPGDFYSVSCQSALAATVDSSVENTNIGVGTANNFRPYNVNYLFTPYHPYDNCSGSYPARNLGTINSTCTYKTASTFNASVSGVGNCATTDDNDVWFQFIKPAGIANVQVTTAPATCQSVSGTSIEIYTACGGASLACATTSTANPGFGEVTVSRTCVAETLWVRVTADGDIPGRFLICAKDGGPGSSTGFTCANATNICGIPYIQTGLSTLGFGNEYDSTNAACHDPFMNGEDYVFSYTPTASGCIRVVVSSTGSNPGVFIFKGCPDAPGTNCIASAVNSTGTLTINSVSLVAGTTYYFVVDNNPAGVLINNIPFDISITSVGTSQTYDACGALNLGSIANNVACTFSTYTTECSTPSPLAYPAPGCAPYFNNVTGDVWFNFTATFTGSVLVKTQPGAVNPASDNAMAVYTGNCISLTLLACDDNSAGAGMPLLSIPVVAGTVYYIRVWTVPPGNTGSFDLCLSSACTPPNDLPCQAVLVNLGGTASGYNTCAGANSEPLNAAQCVAGGIINTVWYKAVVPASGSIKVRTHTRTLADTQIQGFRFPTGCANAATSFVALACNDDGPDCGAGGPQSYHDFSEQLYSGLVPGDTIFIAVDGYNSQTGTFEITIINGTGTYPPIAGADCAAAYEVCGSANISVTDPGLLGYGNICDFANNYNCWANPERNSAWYRVTVNPGVLQFDIQTFSDYDFIMWDVTGLSNACAQIQAQTLASIRCNWVTTVGGHTGINIPDPDASWEPAITVAGGPRTYLILIDNWNPPFQTTGYTLNWLGSPIASVVNSVTWQGAIDTSFGTLSNWGTAPCNALPTCGVDAVISSSGTGLQPTISANMAVKSLTINAGGTLRIKSPSILDVCGDFTNNGTLICEPGSTVRFIGTGIQNINGTLTGANGFANLTINKATGSVVLNANIDVGGNFLTNSATSVFNINGKYMKVARDFTNNNGTTTFTGIGNSTVEFNGTVNQFFTNTSGIINLNRVKMNKTGGKLHLNGANSTMNIDSALTLTAGIIVTRTIPALEVNMKYYLPAAITGHNATSYIDGNLRRKISNPTGPSSPVIPASYDFPVGDSLTPGGYENANITFLSSTLVQDLLAYFLPWPGGPPAIGPAASECVSYTYDLLPAFNHGYWTFKRSTTTFGGSYDITLFNTGMGNNTGTFWTVAKANLISPPSASGSWRLKGACFAASTAAATKRSNMNIPATDSTSFNSLYTTVQSNVQLPIELLYFNAEPEGDFVNCKWETASETNNEYFDVERSLDGNTFDFLGKVSGYGHGTSTENRSYSLIDRDACKDVRYYRLKQVDFDGQFSYSETVAVDCSKDKNFFDVYPNPGTSLVTSSFYEKADGFIKFQWHDLLGQIVKEEVHEVVKGYNKINSKIDDLAAGVYYLRLNNVETVSNDILRQVKFIKN